MIDYYEVSKSIKELLSTIQGIKTCEVGLEDGISYQKAPFLRVVAKETSPSERTQNETLFFDIYLGTTINPTNSTEKVYQEHFGFEKQVKEKIDLEEIHGGLCEWFGTKTDEDSLKNFKVSILNFKLKEVCSGC